jgi:hypothetical protein
MRAEYRTGRADAVFFGWRRQTRVDDPSKEETDMSGRLIAGIGMLLLAACWPLDAGVKSPDQDLIKS